MTLFKQLLIAICLFLVVGFGGSFMVGLETSRNQYVNQLRAHAQDAATALALSLTSALDDPVMNELLISSIFDSGYYTSIRVVELPSGKVRQERLATPMASVPAWFVQLIDLAPGDGSAIVSRGWQPAARVEVVSHPAFAIAKLWQSALGSLGWLMACALASAGFGAWLLRRQLRPLDDMVKQADAIGRREFFNLPVLPPTPELRRVVVAMNQMVDKLRTLFQEQAARTEQLRIEAWQDPLTGLANRRYFDMQLPTQLSAREDARAGYLMLMRVNDMKGLNERMGGAHTDALLIAISEILRRSASATEDSRNVLARVRGGEFALLLPGMLADEAEQLARSLEASLLCLSQTGASDRTPVVFIGLAPYVPDDTPLQVLAKVDQALLEAEAAQGTVWRNAEPARRHTVEKDHRAWRGLLEQALAERRLQLYFQPVMDAHDRRRVLHFKALSRLIDEDGQALPAGRFLPWVERFGWSARHDRLMLETVLEQLRRHDQPVAVSLSAVTLANPHEFDAVLRLLRRHTHLAPRLTLEISEASLPGRAALERLASALGELGYRLALQHFGGRFSMIGNLSSLGLAYLKIDGSYIREIDRESHKRMFIEAMQRAAHSIDLPLMAERVETEGEWQVLREMGIAGVQGRLFGGPAPWA